MRLMFGSDLPVWQAHEDAPSFISIFAVNFESAFVGSVPAT